MPLSGVVGKSELLLDTSMMEEQKLYFSTVKHSTEALLGIVNDALDYSRIEANKLNLYLEQFYLERCIHEIMMISRPPELEKFIELTVDYDIHL